MSNFKVGQTVTISRELAVASDAPRCWVHTLASSGMLDTPLVIATLGAGHGEYGATADDVTFEGDDAMVAWQSLILPVEA